MMRELKAEGADIPGLLSLDDVHVWHALSGAWGGVWPGTIGLDANWLLGL